MADERVEFDLDHIAFTRIQWMDSDQVDAVMKNKAGFGPLFFCSPSSTILKGVIARLI